MTKLYERLAGFNALVGVMALVIGLAAVPQSVSASDVDTYAPSCTGSCSLSCSIITNRCSTILMATCTSGCRTCHGIQMQDSSGQCQSCLSAGCN